MFTAKSQVDDKVAGYDAGVDDYLTKPVHPAELVAHIKALLSRTRARPVAQETPAEKSYMIGCMACRGGLGVSTLTLNLANCYAQANKSKTVIAAELRPGQGTWGFELGFNNPEGLNSLLKHKPAEINADLVNKALVSTGFGIKLLLASTYAPNLDFSTFADSLVSIIGALSRINAVVFVDVGTNYLPGFEQICNYFDNFIILTEPQLITVKRTKVLLDQLEAGNVTSGKALDLVLYNRVRADIQMSSSQVSEEMDGRPVSILIPPSPELANQAAQRHLPMVNLQPDGLVAQQFSRLAEILHDRIDQTK
jgi:pilus assembly protein CpaE